MESSCIDSGPQHLTEIWYRHLPNMSRALLPHHCVRFCAIIPKMNQWNGVCKCELDWSGSKQGPVAGCCENCNEPWGFIKRRMVLEQLRSVSF
jgi:hypothetical protein